MDDISKNLNQYIQYLKKQTLFLIKKDQKVEQKMQMQDQKNNEQNLQKEMPQMSQNNQKPQLYTINENVQKMQKMNNRDIINLNQQQQQSQRSSKKFVIQSYQPAAYGQWKKILHDCANNDGGNQNFMENGNHHLVNKNNQNQSTFVFNRVNHAMFYYKGYIYLYGGSQNHPQPKKNPQNSIQNIQQPQLQPQKAAQEPLLPPQPTPQQKAIQQRKQSLYNSFHKFNPTTKQPSKQSINIGTNLNLFSYISSFGYFVLGSFVYIFGGYNYQTGVRRNSEMCSINLDSGTVKRLESKTSLLSIPSPRLNPVITSIQKSVLLLFGGQIYNPYTETTTYLNDMYTFKIQTKTWTKIQDSFHAKFPIIKRPSLVSFGDNCIYLLGGKREVLGNDGLGVREVDNYKMYKLKIITKMVIYRADCCVKQIHTTNPVPKNQSYVKVLKHNQKGFFAVTTDADKPGVNTHFWYYDHNNAIWTQIKQHMTGIKDYIQGISSEYKEDFALAPEKILTIQRRKNTNEAQFYQFDFNPISLQSVIKQTLSYEKKVLCSICEQQANQNKFIEQKFQITAEKYDQFSSPLQFPFAAIGLLIDNTILTKAKTCNIYFNVGVLGKQTAGEKQKDKDKQKEKDKEKDKNKYLIIQDNGYPGCIWSPQLKAVDFHATISNFSAITAPEQMMASQDNKNLITKCHKQIQQKQKTLQKQFTYFLKNQSKNNSNSASNQGGYNNLNPHLKNQKQFEKQQQQYLQKRQRLQHKQKMLQIQKKCRKFCNNLKLAGTRLGETIIYACKHKKDQETMDAIGVIDKDKDKDKDVRRYFFMRKEKCHITNQFFYVTYAYVTENGNAADPKMQGAIKFLSKQYKKQLKIIAQKFKTMNNVILISELKNMTLGQQNYSSSMSIQKNSEKPFTSMYQMRLKKKQNDIFYGQTSMLNYLQTKTNTKISQKISEICDVSLKAYLSMLYLSRDDRDDPNLNISIRENQLQPINVQPYLLVMDKLLQSKKTIQISKCLNFDDQCPVIQVYWYPQFATSNDTIDNKINLGFMLNGILIYHKGRLISRHGIQLGKLLDNLQMNKKYGSMFGFLDIKEQYGTNMYCTDMFYPRTFEKHFSRLNFVSEFMENKYKDKKVRSRGEDYASGYQKISKRAKYE